MSVLIKVPGRAEAALIVMALAVIALRFEDRATKARCVRLALSISDDLSTLPTPKEVN